MSRAGALLGTALIGSSVASNVVYGQSVDEQRRANNAREGYLDKTALAKFANDEFADVPRSELQPLIDEVWDAHHAKPNVFARFVLGHSTAIAPDDAERSRRELTAAVETKLEAKPG